MAERDSSAGTNHSKAMKLMSFLDRVETEIDDDIVADRTKHIHNAEEHKDVDPQDDDLQFNINLNSSGSNPNDNLFTDIKEKMISLKTQLNDKTATAELLEIALKKARQKQQETEIENKKEIKKQLAKQKKEYEIISNRHLLFIDRLLSDKENLSKKCEDLTEEMRKLNETYKSNLSKIEKEHKCLIRKLKQEWMNAEKIKREEWILNKTKQIKSMTIKGLEPEIQRLIEQNKKDLQLKEEEFADLLSTEKEDIYRKCNEQKQCELETMKTKYLKEIELLNELKEKQLNEQLAQLTKQFEHQLSQQRNQQRLNHEAEISKLSELHETEVENMKQAHLQYVENQSQTHELEIKKMCEKHRIEKQECTFAVYRESEPNDELEIKKMCEKHRIEKQEWMEMMRKKYDAEYKQKQTEFMALTKQQQKDEIDVIIDRLTNELTNQHTEKVNAMASRHHNELSECKMRMEEEKEKSKQFIKEIQSLNEEMKELETKKEKLESVINEKCVEVERMETEKKEIRERNQKQEKVLNDEIAKLKEEHERNMQQMTYLQSKYKVCMEKVNEMESENDKYVEQLQREHLSEIGNIETRIKQTLCKKDEYISQLKQQIQTKNIRIKQVENLLQQQKESLFRKLEQL
eukprot:CAMPEP_0197077662 /NCGR_PEP_ID=MMETSP1384-20130603/212729_1 /TAXON_ID=29189 /ORGANISM="Ammonia sp." /LENGTH=632 /DNA_ID=CAMNT_0042516527 /DNA_START=56 /DNA_END=1955 /DNA_ORIENTATION=-